MCVSLLGAQRERSLTDWEGQGEGVMVEFPRPDLEGCMSDHRREGKHFKI